MKKVRATSVGIELTLVVHFVVQCVDVMMRDTSQEYYDPELLELIQSSFEGSLDEIDVFISPLCRTLRVFLTILDANDGDKDDRYQDLYTSIAETFAELFQVRLPFLA